MRGWGAEGWESGGDRMAGDLGGVCGRNQGLCPLGDQSLIYMSYLVANNCAGLYMYM